MKATVKQYRCPTCGNIEMHLTNHFGEIYSPCRKCKAMVLYCNEVYAIADFEERKQVKAQIHWYLFDIDDPSQLEAYAILEKGLRDLDKSKFNGYVSYQYKMALKEHAQGQKITVYNKETFKEQYISSVGRLHDWQEFPYDNLDIKEGYWLEFI